MRYRRLISGWQFSPPLKAWGPFYGRRAADLGQALRVSGLTFFQAWKAFRSFLVRFLSLLKPLSGESNLALGLQVSFAGPIVTVESLVQFCNCNKADKIFARNHLRAVRKRCPGSSTFHRSSPLQ